VVGRVAEIRVPFLQQQGAKAGGPIRVADDSDADSILRFWLERGGDGTKHYKNMKRRRRARLGSMGRQRVMVRWRGDIDRRRESIQRGKERRRLQLT
jgi:hypothetical protein